jgi:tetratricopeptide (TPR) repeat protein
MDPAEEFKTQGNERYKNGDYEGAIAMYTQAIEAAPTVVAYYGNRAAAAFMLGNYKDVVVDCNRALVFDPTFFKGYIRKAKAQLALVRTSRFGSFLRGYASAMTMDIDPPHLNSLGRDGSGTQDAADWSDPRPQQPDTAHREAPDRDRTRKGPARQGAH